MISKESYLAHITLNYPRIWMMRLDVAMGITVAFWLLCLSLAKGLVVSSTQVVWPSDAESQIRALAFDMAKQDPTFASRYLSRDRILYRFSFSTDLEGEERQFNEDLTDLIGRYPIFEEKIKKIKELSATIIKYYAQLKVIEEKDSVITWFLVIASTSLSAYWLWLALRAMKLPYAPRLANYPGFLSFFLPLLLLNCGLYIYFHATGIFFGWWQLKDTIQMIIGGYITTEYPIPLRNTIWTHFGFFLLILAFSSYISLLSLLGTLCPVREVAKAVATLGGLLIPAAFAVGTFMNTPERTFWTFTAIPIALSVIFLISYGKASTRFVGLLARTLLISTPILWWVGIFFVFDNSLTALRGYHVVVLAAIFIVAVYALTRLLRRIAAAPS